MSWSFLFFFFFNDTATTEIYTLSLHDALPICSGRKGGHDALHRFTPICRCTVRLDRDRKSTRLNSSHLVISYAVFCLKKKKTYPQASITSYGPMISWITKQYNKH